MLGTKNLAANYVIVSCPTVVSDQWDQDRDRWQALVNVVMNLQVP
jgi:hypothetical protein